MTLIQNLCEKCIISHIKNSFIELGIADAVFDKLYEVLGLRKIWMNILWLLLECVIFFN